MKPHVLKFHFPMPPNRANARGHWRKHHRGMTAYYSQLDALLMFRRLPKPPRTPYGEVRATATLHLYNLMDQGNALNRLKWIEDWLVSRDYVVDDSPKHFTYTGLPTQVIDRKNQRIELELSPVGVVEDDRGPEAA